jgi:membrane associated rhomboid family serine protease
MSRDRGEASEWALLKGELRWMVRVFGAIVAVLWIEEIVDAFLLGGALDAYGIRPREPASLGGVLLMPLLHGGFPHLVANTVTLCIFGPMLLLRGVRRFAWTTLAITLLSGLGVWLFARPGSLHIGASGVLFGYFGMLLTAGIFERRAGPLLVSLFVGSAFGATLLGVLPGQEGISWEGHLFGFLAGMLVAWTAAVLERRRARRSRTGGREPTRSFGRRR